MATLSIVGTPIGNLEDMTLRALRIFKEADFIICEDTRVTSKLLTHFEIKKSLVSYFQHSRFSRIDEIIARLARGESAALVTDAGTPGISDPGGVLVKEVVKRLGDSVKIVTIPGPSAVVAALSISGLPTNSFLFLGFPPHKKGRQTFFKQVAESEETVVFYESPHRIVKSLEQLRDALHAPSPQSSPTRGEEENINPSPRGRGPASPDERASRGGKGEGRQVVVCRELTKMFESVYRGEIANVIGKVKADPIKGEYVVIVGALRR